VNHWSITRKAALVVALGTLAACSTTAQAEDRQPHTVPAAQAGITKIKHVVVLMQENRSYDSYFGHLYQHGQPASSVEPNTGNPDPVHAGKVIRPYRMTKMCTVSDLDHSWTGTHEEWNNGKMNGFTAANVDSVDPVGRRAMGYYDDSVLPFYYSLANQFAIADHYFASVLTQTFPNRFYLLTGTSFGHIRNDYPPAGGYTQKTVFRLLDEATPKVSWKIYLASAQVELLFKYVQRNLDHVKTMSQYYKDAAAGKLPQVAFVESDPLGDVNHESDEHPPANVQVGQRFTHDVIKALVASPNWSSSAMFLTYDEHGGYYDHVPPPPARAPDNIPPMRMAGDAPGGFDRYGIRVPTIVISPYARKHFVSHTTYDHTSILRFIEKRFGLPALTKRDKAADPMLGMFDFTKISNPKPTIIASPVSAAGKAACIKLHPNAKPATLDAL
jgi:phospholipase C